MKVLGLNVSDRVGAYMEQVSKFLDSIKTNEPLGVYPEMPKDPEDLHKIIATMRKNIETYKMYLDASPIEAGNMRSIVDRLLAEQITRVLLDMTNQLQAFQNSIGRDNDKLRFKFNYIERSVAKHHSLSGYMSALCTEAEKAFSHLDSVKLILPEEENSEFFRILKDAVEKDAALGRRIQFVSNDEFTRALKEQGEKNIFAQDGMRTYSEEEMKKIGINIFGNGKSSFSAFMKIGSENKLEAALVFNSKDEDKYKPNTDITFLNDQLLSLILPNILKLIKIEKGGKDALTRLFNRQGFKEESDKLLARLADNKDLGVTAISAISLDLDFFKQVNDTFGHAAGDMVLGEVARVLEGVVQTDRDIVARFGGEEFVVLVAAGEEVSLKIAETIRRKIANLPFNVNQEGMLVLEKDKGGEQWVSTSVGVVPYVSGVNLDDCLEKSDKVSYLAKEAGRNRVYQADGTLFSEGEERVPIIKARLQEIKAIQKNK